MKNAPRGAGLALAGFGTISAASVGPTSCEDAPPSSRLPNSEVLLESADRAPIRQVERIRSHRLSNHDGIGHGALLGWNHRRERERLSATGSSFIRHSNEAGGWGESTLLFLEVGESRDEVFTLPEFTILAFHKLLRFLDGLFLVRTFDASYC